MTAAALIFCIAVLYLVLLHVSEKKGGRWETVTAVLGFVLFTPLVLAYGSFVSLLTVGLPLKCILPESVWDVIRVRFGDGKIDVWTLPSMIPWGIIGWLEIAVARRLWRGWQRRRDKALRIEKEIRPVSEIKIVEPPPPSRVERFFGLRAL